jgi:hypothetical protein
MSYRKPLIMALGLLAIAAGALWIGQGTGYIPWPRSSFMISQMPWAYRGAGLVLVGIGAILWARKL